MLEYNTILINIDELWLKGKNRKLYVKQLHKNISSTIRAWWDSEYTIVQEGPKFIFESNESINNELIEFLSKIPGIHSLYLVKKVKLDKQAIEPALVELAKDWGSFKTFKISSRRSDKRFDLNSMELSAYAGGIILRNFDNINVNLTEPDVTFYLRVMASGIYVYSRKIKATGGLPVGMGGHLLCMLSGGFDSPVASYLMSRRGCEVSHAFFYSYPYVGEDVKNKIIDLAKALAPYQNNLRLFIVPFGKIQAQIAKVAEQNYRTILFRKLMVECSNALAKVIGAQALLTGDALGQVSSQTIENMSAIDQSSELPIFRPLVGSLKEEIIEWSRKIGTHDISKSPHDDACSMFAPKSPVIRADMRYWKKFEEENDFSELISEAINDIEVICVNKRLKIHSFTIKDFSESHKWNLP